MQKAMKMETTPFANKLVTARGQRDIGTPVAGMVPNEEQEAILAASLCLEREKGDNSPRVLVICAGAGSGKTATCKMEEQILSGRGQYTAFNSSLVNEARTKFIRARCNTTHSLAFRSVGRLYQHRLPGPNRPRMRTSQIAKILGIESMTLTLADTDEHGKPRTKRLTSEFLASRVLETLKRFRQSADRNISKRHIPYIEGIDTDYIEVITSSVTTERRRGDKNNQIVKNYLLPFCQKAWDDILDVDGQLPFSHDDYVKIWQLGEGKQSPLIEADYILLDEYQDTAPVFLDVLSRQNHALLIMVGDDNQRIYEWRGAVNAAEYFPDAPRRLLSQSYRFGQSIADVANTVLSTLDEPTDLVMRGNPAIPSRVDSVGEPHCYLYRINAGAVSQLMRCVEEGYRTHLIGGGEQIINFCRAALDLQASPSRGTQHPELACFDNWKEVQEYVTTDEGSDLKLMVKLIDTFTAQKIIDALKDMPTESDADVVISTVHKAKGREWDTVKLGGDFPGAHRMNDSDRRLLYVAVTRAVRMLDITECPPFCGCYERRLTIDGYVEEWMPGLTVHYTKPMPTLEECNSYLTREKETPPSPTVPVAQAQPITLATQNTTSRAPVTRFTWTMWDGDWAVRGPSQTPIGQTVQVHRKDGTIRVAVLRAVLAEFEDAWIYSV